MRIRGEPIDTLAACAAARRERNDTLAEVTMNETLLDVPDISCAHCERAVTLALGDLAGVERVAVDIPAKLVRVAYDPKHVDLDRVTTALAGEGYAVVTASATGTSDASTTTIPVAGCSCCTPAG